MAQAGGREEELLNYVNTQTHKSNLRNALDYHSVREPDLELVSKEGRRLFGHRSVLGIFSPMLVDIFSYTPCCQKASIMFPDTTSEILSHLLNVLYTGSTEATSDKVDVLCGKNGVFATAKLLGIEIKTDQKVIEVIDKRENIVDTPHLRVAPAFRSETIEPSIHEADVNEDCEDSIVVEGDEEPETMEICPQIPMFDLGSLLYQEHQDPSDYLAEEEPIPAPIPVENEDYYICKLPSCQTIIQFENCGARSKILNHYTSHFQRELEQTYGHLITEEQQCTLCEKDLRNFIKSKIWIHIGVTHDKTNDILVNRGIEPILKDIRMKRKASDAFREEVSPRFDESHPGLDFQVTPSHRTNTCKICGQVTQNRKRLLKHYCTKHYIDRLGMMEYQFIEKNKCVHCDKDFIGAKKSSKVIHIGVEHKKIFEILEEEFGKDGYLKHDSLTPAMPPLKKIKTNEVAIQPPPPKIDFSNPHTPAKVEYVTPILSFHNTPRTDLSMSDKMKEIQDLGNKCMVCDKKFDLFRSMLLPHYCGHFYKEIAQGHEDYFTLENCKLCGAKATKRKSRIIHLGVKHELVLPYIEEVLRNKDMSAEPGQCLTYEGSEGIQNEGEEEEEEIEVKQELETVSDVVDEIVLNNETHVNELDNDVKTEQSEHKVVTPIRIKTINLKNFKSKDVQNHVEGIIKKEVVGVQEVKKIKTEEDEDRRTPTQILMKNQNKEVWITPTKSREEVSVKRTNQLKNLDNQERSYHLDKLFNESPESVDELNDECYEDEVTMDNLGLVCKICNVTEATDHELLTHYCSHFNDELKLIAERMIDEDHKCVECHKMLGNNKRRLYHFGVKHLKVIPMINRKLRSQSNSGSPIKNFVPRSGMKHIEDEPSEDLTEEDEFEITYDQPVKIVEEHSAYKDALPLQIVKKRSELKPKHSNPRVCELCGCKRNTNSNLLLHYTKQHFMKDIKERFGSLIVDNRCTLCDDLIDVTMKNVGEAEKWIHLGHKHSKTNEILQEMGKTQIIIKDKKDVSYLQNAEPVVETKILESVHNVHNPEIFQSSEDEISSSPPQPEPEVFSCQLCDKTTKNQTLLDLHLIAIHFKKEILHQYGNPENTCELCSKTFPNADGFAFHLGQDHDLLRLIMQRRAKKIAAMTESQGPARLPEVKTFTPIKQPEVKVPTPKPQELPSFPCFKCGARRRSKKELYGHYSLQHFSKELMEEFGVQKKCTIEECGKILENGTTWISHLGQEHPAVVDKYIPERFWLKEERLKCPLKCSTPFSEQTELLTHFRVVHGFNSDIIKKVIKAHPQLNALNEENYGKGIEA